MAVARGEPGFGTDALKLAVPNIATNTGNTNVTIPQSGTFAQPFYQGTVRVFTTTVGVNATCKVAAIFGIDASNVNNVIQVYGGDGSASPAGVGIDESFILRPGTSLGSLNVVVNVATNNCTHEIHISGNPSRSVSP